MKTPDPGVLRGWGSLVLAWPHGRPWVHAGGGGRSSKQKERKETGVGWEWGWMGGRRGGGGEESAARGKLCACAILLRAAVVGPQGPLLLASLSQGHI